jgi:hypothetical protein
MTEIKEIMAKVRSFVIGWGMISLRTFPTENVRGDRAVLIVDMSKINDKAGTNYSRC